MQYARPQFDADEAARLLSKRRFDSIRKLFGGVAAPPIRIELVYIPHFVITIPVFQGESKSTVTAAIEASSGAFSLRRYTDDILASEMPDRADEFAPRISEEEALAIARDGILKNALRERGGRRSFKWADPESVELLQHPFWVYYHHRRRGFIDIRLLDAVTGDRPGSKTKGGVLDAFVAARRQTPSAFEDNTLEQSSS